MTARLILITGAQAAGKTTIGAALARLLPQAVHIDGDIVHDFVVSGAIGMDVPPPAGALEQLYLRYRGSLAVANVYRDKGFDAIVTDNMFGPALTDVIAMGHDSGDVHVVVLDPDVAVIADRERGRDKTGYSETLTPRVLVDALRNDTPRVGLWHDNATETVAQTAARLLQRLDEALVPRSA